MYIQTTTSEESKTSFYLESCFFSESTCQISSIEEQEFRNHDSKSSYVEIPGAFQYRDILFVPESDSAIVASTDHLYKISLNSFRESAQSDWVPSSSFIDELVDKDDDGLWRRTISACSRTTSLSQKLDQSKIESWEKLTNITCRWYFHSMSPIHQGIHVLYNSFIKLSTDLSAGADFRLNEKPEIVTILVAKNDHFNAESVKNRCFHPSNLTSKLFKKGKKITQER